MQSPKKKLLVALLFVAIILSAGYALYFSKLKGRKSIKTHGVKTDFNPSYVDSIVELNKEK